MNPEIDDLVAFVRQSTGFLQWADVVAANDELLHLKWFSQNGESCEKTISRSKVVGMVRQNVPPIEPCIESFSQRTYSQESKETQTEAEISFSFTNKILILTFFVIIISCFFYHYYKVIIF